MALNSVDSVLAAISAGRSYQLPFWRRINTGATSAAGRWHGCLSDTDAGTGGSMTLTGSAGVGIALDKTTNGRIPEPTEDVSPRVKRITTFSAQFFASTAAPAELLLTDLLYLYPSCVVTGTPTALDNTAAKPARFNSGLGVQCSCLVVGALGAAQPGLTLTYTNSGGTGSRTGAFKASANSLPVGSMLSGGTVASIGSPYSSLDAGDGGIQQLDSYTIAAGTTGTVSFLLHRPIISLPLARNAVRVERDCLFQLPTLPKIDDGACLGLLIRVGALLAVDQIISGDLTCIWD